MSKINQLNEKLKLVHERFHEINKLNIEIARDYKGFVDQNQIKKALEVICQTGFLVQFNEDDYIGPDDNG